MIAKEMINITEEAKARLYSLLGRRGGSEVSLRLVVTPMRRIGLVLDKQSSKDEVIEHNGIRVLLIGEEVMSYLSGVTLDTKREDGNCTLVMARP